MTFEELQARAREQWEALEKSPKPRILVGTATCGRSAGALSVLEAIEKTLKEKQIDAIIMQVGCIGLCYAEPLVDIIKPGRPRICYGNITPKSIPQLLEDYLIKDNPRPDLALGVIGDGSIEGIPRLFDLPVLKPQVRRVLKNCGLIDPTNIYHYIAQGGYSGFVKALKMKPEEIIEVIKRSGLRGRGGGGFPTGTKWEFCRKAKGEPKYIICNADEGNPGAFMNRSLLEGDPHSVLEGMLIGGYAIGAKEGYIYCRAEYPLALERLRIAIKQMEEVGLLGDNIFGSGFSFHIKIKEGAGAFVCGEETALMASIEGKRGMPRSRPPFPATSGLWGKPTNINNVETWACVALILQNSPEWFAQYGTEKSKGTKTFSLVGKVKRTGLIEVPLGITLRQIIYEIGGGIIEDKAFKAVQTGGPSGGCLPATILDVPFDYESLTAAGSIMGSGGIIVMDEETCIVDMAHHFLSFTQKESCGKCVPCRVGTRQMLEILERITQGMGKDGDIELLQQLAEIVKSTSLCGLGGAAPNPVLTTIRYFRDEYEAHIKEKRCPALVCKMLPPIPPCQAACPAGVRARDYIALIAQGRFLEALKLIRESMPFAGVCGRVCTHPCEVNCERGKIDQPIAIRALKRFVSDYELKVGREKAKPIPKLWDEKIAIIGSGPAGLACAYDLVREGYPVTVFEAMPEAGGLLRYGIPDYRLPKSILDNEISYIQELGVEIKTNTPIRNLEELFNQRYKAFFIATGAGISQRMRIPNEDAEGVLYALDFLKKVNSGERISLGSKVAVIGGGNAAIDSSRVALRLGAKDVNIIYRRSRAEMPAISSEVEEAEKEGVKITFLAAPTKIITKDGKVSAIECIRMMLGEPDETGRPRPIPIKGSEFVMEVDNVIIAIGQLVDRAMLPSGLEFTDEGNLKVDPITFQTNIKGVFAGGDVVTGPADVISAIASGKEAAISISRYLRGVDLMEGRPKVMKKVEKVSKEGIAKKPRAVMPLLELKKRSSSFAEVELGFDEKTAIEEAMRCLNCGLAEKIR